MTRMRLVLGLSLLVAGPAAAQSVPPIMKPKVAAEKAVAATNAHTAAMTAEPRTALEEQGGARPDSVQGTEGTRATQSAGGSTAVPSTPEPARADTAFRREVYSYESAGRRDPFVSLMTIGELRPLLTDLKVQGILYDANGHNSVAMLQDATSKEEYRVKAGMTIGRMRVARIDAKSVTFTIEEFGFSRQETLALGDPNKEKGK